MTLEVGKETKIKLSIETIISMGGMLVVLATMWFTLKADIAEAKVLPKPDITRIEFDMKDELIRQTIMNTQDDVLEIKENMKLIKQKLYE
tara:strand:+ start:18412 stop:18681 length:270 start_codon:yes stop_codon:yes gene_type:complete